MHRAEKNLRLAPCTTTKSRCYIIVSARNTKYICIILSCTVYSVYSLPVLVIILAKRVKRSAVVVFIVWHGIRPIADHLAVDVAVQSAVCRRIVDVHRRKPSLSFRTDSRGCNIVEKSPATKEKKSVRSVNYSIIITVGRLD